MNEKTYIVKAAKILSDKSVDNENGQLFFNTEAGVKFFMPKAQVKNIERELTLYKTNLCDYAKEIFTEKSENANDSEKEYYDNAVEFYTVALEKDYNAKNIYEGTAIIVKNSMNEEFVSEDTLSEKL